MIRNAEHGVLTHYDPDGYYCEMMGRSGAAAEHTRPVRRILDELNLDTLRARARDAERELYNLGITFTVYSDSDAVDRILPFDVIPRILSRSDWRLLKDGVTQRVTALNLFLHDVYHEQKILKDGVVPAELILANKQFMSAACGIDRTLLMVTSSPLTSMPSSSRVTTDWVAARLPAESSTITRSPGFSQMVILR